MNQKIAIIGTGIAGLTCGYLLNRRNSITVYEANDYIGGHTATRKVEVMGQQYEIDTGFIVFNDWTYPNFIALMEKLNVASQATEMSFSVHSQQADLEYNGNNLNSLFAQRRNLVRPRFLRMVADIIRFNRTCKAIDTSRPGPATTLYEFIREHKFGDDFAHYYILPMCAAIWSASLAQIKQFPLELFLQFFNNHGLLNITNRPQWYTLIGGSHRYVAPLTASFNHKIKLSTPVHKVYRDNTSRIAVEAAGQTNYYDHVIFACHSDEALSLLDEPTSQHRDILSHIPYSRNEVVLHHDTSVLPTRKLAWASWNYKITTRQDEMHRPASVTYNMNILQRLNAPVTFCVSLNHPEPIDESKILGRYEFYHPQFSRKMTAAQQRRSEICGVDNMHFCGAYWYNGFHEDGVKSALDVCARFGEKL